MKDKKRRPRHILIRKFWIKWSGHLSDKDGKRNTGLLEIRSRPVLFLLFKSHIYRSIRIPFIKGTYSRCCHGLWRQEYAVDYLRGDLGLIILSRKSDFTACKLPEFPDPLSRALSFLQIRTRDTAYQQTWLTNPEKLSFKRGEIKAFFNKDKELTTNIQSMCLRETENPWWKVWDVVGSGDCRKM